MVDVKAQPKFKTTVFMSPEQMLGLKTIYDKTGIPNASVIRQGMDLIIEVWMERLTHWGRLTDGDVKHLEKLKRRIDRAFQSISNEEERTNGQHK